MADLIAQGPRPGQRWRKKLTPMTPIVLGRAAMWSVPWDEHISRQHAELNWSNGTLSVTQISGARNPVFFSGETCQRCTLVPGQHFVIGATTFSLVDETVSLSNDSPAPALEHTFTLDDLHRSSFRDAAQRIEVLSRLPEIISGDMSDEELCGKLVSLVLAGIPQATFAAVAALDPNDFSVAANLLHWDQPGDRAHPILPSERLIRQTIRSGTSMAHIWSPLADEKGYTQAEAITWAFCTPLRYSANRGWCVYVAGNSGPTGRATPSDFADLQDDVKFTELVSDTVGRLRELRRLERRQASLAQFISPVVLERVGLDDPTQAFAPREAEISVLFCDLRGFSRASERGSRDLMKLLERVSGALGVMTRHILDSGGVIGDFHGDAAMGFWGWPFDQPDRVQRACETALSISSDFANAAKHSGHPLADFQIGIGIATGRAVAGRIGTAEQVKITVFGPVVNLAARLQDLTKLLRAPILVDESTAQTVRSSLSPAIARVRQVARLRPRGLESALMVSELLPPENESSVTDNHIALYEQALDALQAGDFERSFSLLHGVPAEDRVKDFLTVFIAQQHRQPPAGWTGIIDLNEGG